MRSWLDDDVLMSMPARAFVRKLRAACKGDQNEFSPYLRILPVGQGPPEE